MQLFHLPMSRKLSNHMFYALVAIILKIMAASTNLIGFIPDAGISHGFHNEGSPSLFLHYQKVLAVKLLRCWST